MVPLAIYKVLILWHPYGMIRLAVRGYLDRALKFEEHLELSDAEIPSLIGLVGEKHAEAMAIGELDMVEFEFLDDPDPLQRFFRIGTNPSLMVKPMQISP